MEKTKKEFFNLLKEERNKKRKIEFPEFFCSFPIKTEKSFFIVGGIESINFYSKNKELFFLQEKDIIKIKAKNIWTIKVEKNEIIDYYLSKKENPLDISIRNLFLKNFYTPIIGVKEYLDFKPMINYKLDNLINESLKAKEQILIMYDLFKKEKIFEEQIPILLSFGLLGKEKREVETKNAISAYHSVIADYFEKKIRNNEIIEENKAFFYEAHGNKLIIFLLKEPLSFEITEKIKDKIFKDKETTKKVTNPNTSGAFYAIKMASYEYLDKIDKQAKVVVFRIIEDYEIPLGSWFLMELTRKTFEHSISFEKGLEIIKKYGLNLKFFKNTKITSWIKSSRT